MDLIVYVIFILVGCGIGYLFNLHKIILRKPVDKSSGRILREDVLKNDRVFKFYLKSGEAPCIPDEVVDIDGKFFKIATKTSTGFIDIKDSSYDWKRFYFENFKDYVNQQNDNLIVVRYNDDKDLERLTNENFGLKNEIVRLRNELLEFSQHSNARRLKDAKIEHNIDKYKLPKLPYYINSNKNSNSQQPPVNVDDQGDTV